MHCGLRNAALVLFSFCVGTAAFKIIHSRRLWRSRRRNSSSVPEGGARFPSSHFPCRRMPKPWQGYHFAPPENQGIIFQQRRNLSETFPATQRLANRNLQTVFREFLDKGLEKGVAGVALQGAVSNHLFQITINSLPNIRKP